LFLRIVWKATKEIAVGFAVSSSPSPDNTHRYVQPFVIGFNPPMISGQETLNVFDTNGKAGFDLTTTTPTTTTNVKE